MSRKLDLIKRILVDHPVTDPRAALMAIEKVLATKKGQPESKPINLLKLSMDRIEGGKVTVTVKHDDAKLKPEHINLIAGVLFEFTKDTFGQRCDDCDPMKQMVMIGDSAVVLGELFKQFEVEARNATGIDPKKGK